MATSVATPVIGLYATSNPYRTGPYLSLQHVVNAYPEALLKFLHKKVSDVRWGQRVRDADAMHLIQLTDVKNRVDQIMTKGIPDQN
jgi:heptosyltransferase I